MGPGVTFSSWVEGRLIVLAELLAVLDDLLGGLRWRLRSVELAPGPHADALYAASEREMSTEELTRLVPADLQVVDGELVARRSQDNEPWLIVRAVDGSHWDVHSEDERVLDVLRAHFDGVEDLPA